MTSHRGWCVTSATGLFIVQELAATKLKTFQGTCALMSSIPSSEWAISLGRCWFLTRRWAHSHDYNRFIHIKVFCHSLLDNGHVHNFSTTSLLGINGKLKWLMQCTNPVRVLMTFLIFASINTLLYFKVFKFGNIKWYSLTKSSYNFTIHIIQPTNAIMLKLHFLHTIGKKSSVFRSIVFTFKELLNINIAYVKIWLCY